MIVPSEWFIAFKYNSKLRWVGWFNRRFRHCIAFCWVEDVKAWIIVEYGLRSGSMVSVVPMADDEDFLARITADAVVVKVKAAESWGPKWGLWCVPLTAQVVGIKTCALRVDRLYRDCLAQGGEIITGGDD